MKEVERFSLGGYAFTLEQDAATLVGDYLGELEIYYDGREGGSDIMEGIEERMAELLLEKAGRDGVCTREMIEQIIGILGKPEIIEAAGEDTYDGEQSSSFNGEQSSSFAGSTGASSSSKRWVMAASRRCSVWHINKVRWAKWRRGI